MKIKVQVSTWRDLPNGPFIILLHHRNNIVQINLMQFKGFLTYRINKYCSDPK